METPWERMAFDEMCRAVTLWFPPIRPLALTKG
jgi:hypothetical protein